MTSPSSHKDSKEYSRHQEDTKDETAISKNDKEDSQREHRHRRRRDRSSKRSRRRRRRHEKDKKSSSSSKKPILPQPPANVYPMGDPLGHAPPTTIDPDRDYFAFHREFWVYLYRQEGIYFNDLTSTEETHEAFGRFAQAYNTGQLERPYYASASASQEGWPTFPPAVLEECKTTQHRWTFRTTETEEKGLQALQAGVRRLTEYNKEDSKH
eukprot:Nitzschia sp. Nitz4//scaffold305_size22082//12855//13673//NITZ4_008583-RA/size22082-augustus-gene-0.23-mRNA-1//-1//CDS//3329547092//7558//frame0